VKDKSKNELIKEIAVLQEALTECLVAVGLALKTVLDRYPQNHSIVAELLILFYVQLSHKKTGQPAIDESTLETYCERIGFDQVTTAVIIEKFRDIHKLLQKYRTARIPV